MERPTADHAAWLVYVIRRTAWAKGHRRLSLRAAKVCAEDLAAYPEAAITAACTMLLHEPSTPFSLAAVIQLARAMVIGTPPTNTPETG